MMETVEELRSALLAERARAIKKMLMAGQHGHKNGETYRREAIQAIERAIELESDRTPGYARRYSEDDA